MKLPDVTRRKRWMALAVVLLAQSMMFGFFLRRGPELVSDNVRYEEGGWSIARGRGLALPFTMSPDPDVRSWVCDRHPEACTDGFYPSAQYPPGYQVFIGGVYTVTGRSLWAIAIAHLVLLWGLFACFELLAARFLSKAGYWFVMAIATTYPFLARQATLIMSDHVHTFLLLASITALMVVKPGWRRTILFGALFGLATFARTYTIAVLPFLFGWPRIRRAFAASRGEWAAGLAVCLLPFVIWTARNEYWFGRFIPFSTAGLGPSLYLNKLEVEVGSSYGADQDKTMHDALFATGEDIVNWHRDRELQAEAIVWMKAHPAEVAGRLVGRVPRLWISKGEAGKGVSAAYPVLILYLGGLMILGVLGMWSKRKDDRWKAPMIIIVLTWMFLLHTPAEARRTLPLRLPMLLFAGFAIDEGVKRWAARRALAAPALKR